MNAFCESGKQRRRWAAWLAIFCILLLAEAWLPNLSVAQTATRKLRWGPTPEYPEIARKLNIKGLARVRLIVSPDGRVKDVRELGGNPVLLAALVDAVKKWRYEPASAESQIEVKYDFQ